MSRFFYSSSNLQNFHNSDSLWKRWRKKSARKKALKQLDANLVNVNNPFRKERGKNKTFGWIKILIVFILFFSWVAALFYAPYFKINKIIIEGTNIIKEDELELFLTTNFFINSNWWPTDNYFILNNKKIENKIKDNFAIEKVAVEKIFPDSIKVIVEEKTTGIIYDNGKDYFLLGESGSLIKKIKSIPENEFFTEDLSNVLTSAISASSTTSTTSTSVQTIRIHKPNFDSVKKEVGSLPLIYDHRPGKENAENLEPEIVYSILKWHKLFSESSIGEPKYFILDNLYAGLKVEIGEMWHIKIGIHGNYENSIRNLEIIIKDQTPNEYVDLRYGERAVWK